MSATSENNKRIAKNTLFLYLRMLLIMGVTLYTSRVVLRVLGVEDFGIYSAVGGFVSMFAVISGSLTAAISRFITYEMGVGNTEKIARIFSVSVVIQLLISGIIVLFSETLGLWFLNMRMNIPTDRLLAANWVYQFSILTFVINLISIPYNASIVAHERMSAFAYISFFQAFGTLVIAFLLDYSPWDLLVFYAFLMALLAFFVRFLYTYYCKKHFSECRFQWIWDKVLIKQVFGFAGWNFLGASSGVLRDQGVNVLLNIFCGPAVNAARGIAMQVNAAVNSFVNNFMIALNPQITKSYASGDRVYLMNLVFQGSRYSFYLLLLLSLPILLETPVLLKLWLGVVPDHTVAFVRLILLYALSESVSQTLITLMLATGRIRNYQLLVGGCQMLNFPVAYILLKLGYAPETTIVLSIIIAVCCLFLRLYMLRGMVGLPIRLFFTKVLLNIFRVMLLALVVPVCVISHMEEGLVRLVLNGMISTCATGCSILFIGCSREERLFVWQRISQLKNKFLK